MISNFIGVARHKITKGYRWLGLNFKKLKPGDRINLVSAAATLGIALLAWHNASDTSELIGEMEFEKRPWLEIDNDGFQIIKVIKERNQISLQTGVILKNVGFSPAQNVKFNAEVIRSRSNVLEEEKNFCSANSFSEISGDLMFSGDPHGVQEVSRSDFKREWIDNPDGFKPIMIGCITYSWGNPESSITNTVGKHIGRTMVIWEIKGPDDDKPVRLADLDHPECLRMFWYQEDGKDVGRFAY